MIQTQKVPFPNDQGSQPRLPIMEVAASDVRLTRIPYAWAGSKFWASG